MVGTEPAETLAFRDTPSIRLSPVEPGYARFLIEGFDTVKETLNVWLPESTADTLDRARAYALDLDERGGGKHTIEFGGEEVQVSPFGGRGVRWWLENDDFALIIRSPKTEWCITVRYSAAGLWEHGLDALRARALAMVLKEGEARGDDWQRVSEVHWAFDFHSPAFTREMVPAIMGQVVCHSSTKKRANAKIELETWGRADYLETLSIGSNASSLQIQVYDKGKEIKEASGKTWMVDLWRRGGWQPEDEANITDVWRVEIRMRKEFLKERGVNRWDEFAAALPELITEALVTRRLAVPGGKTLARQWAMHPLWSLAYRVTGGLAQMMPLGRQVTEAGDVLKDRLIKAAVGTARAATVLAVGGWDEGTFDQVIAEMKSTLAGDEGHDRKVEVLEERYRYVNEARG